MSGSNEARGQAWGEGFSGIPAKAEGAERVLSFAEITTAGEKRRANRGDRGEVNENSDEKDGKSLFEERVGGKRAKQLTPKI